MNFVLSIKVHDLFTRMLMCLIYRWQFFNDDSHGSRILNITLFSNQLQGWYCIMLYFNIFHVHTEDYDAVSLILLAKYAYQLQIYYIK